MNLLLACNARFVALCRRLPESLLQLLARLAVAAVFWRSAQTKFTGWELFGQSWQFFNISPATTLLFQYEYQLPLLSPQVAACAATTAEFFFALMLALGLGTRLAALGLFAVTAVIQLLVLPSGWPAHILWAALLLYLLKHGGGRLALDTALARLMLRGDHAAHA